MDTEQEREEVECYKDVSNNQTHISSLSNYTSQLENYQFVVVLGVLQLNRQKSLWKYQMLKLM